MPYLGSQRTVSPSVQVSDLASGVVTVPSNVNITGSGQFELIQNYVFDGTASEVTFSSIPSVYDHLWLIVEARNTSASNRALQIQFNGDTTAGNYAWNAMYEENSTQTAEYVVSSQTTIAGFNTPGTGMTANYAAIYWYQILGIQEATHKNLFLRAARITSVTTESVNGLLQGIYQGSTSPITSLRLFSAFSPNFVSGSTAALYGIRGI